MQRPPFSICICPDSRLLRDRLDTLCGQFPPDGPGTDWKRFFFWADEGLTAHFWEHLTLQGLFAQPECLVIRNAQELDASTLKELSASLIQIATASTPSLAWPVICFEVPLEKGKPKIAAHILKTPFYEQGLDKGWVEIIPGLTAQSMPRFIQARATQLGLKLAPGEFACLCQALRPDASSILTELEKLSVLADSNGRLPEDALSVQGEVQELGIFELLRGIQSGRQAAPVWKKVMEDRISGENTIFAFIAILLREARILWQVLCGEPAYLPPQAMAQKQALAKSMGFARISRIWELALQADKGIKSGERSPEQAFEVLIADLFSLFSHEYDKSRP